MNPVFSIIIPLYNKEKTLYKTVESVFYQTFMDFEVIVVNDGSTDGSIRILDGFTDDRLIVLHKKNGGVSTARNLGIKNAKGNLIAFLDADDYWEEDHLLALLKLYHTFPEAGMYAMGYRKIYSETIQRSAVFKGIPKNFSGIIPNYFEASAVDSLASSSSVCIASKVFHAIGNFNPKMQSGEDTEMWIRIALQYTVAVHYKITANYRIRIENSLSKGTFTSDRLLLFSKFAPQEQHHPTLKKYLDLNRYAMAISCILQKDKTHKRALLKDINYRNLNRKQRVLLQMPRIVLKLLKIIQDQLARKRIFLSAFTR